LGLESIGKGYKKMIRAMVAFFESFHSNPAVNTKAENPCESERVYEKKKFKALGFGENGEVCGSQIVAWYNLGKGGF